MKEGRASRTAIRIAHLMLHLSERPRYQPLIPPALAEATRAILEAAGLQGIWNERVQRARASRGLLGLIDWVLGGGMQVHFPLRKAFIEDHVRQAVGDGAGQLLVIGAGLDTLAPRLAAEIPALRAVEVDHPASSAAKARGVAGAGLRSANLRLVAKDLAAHPLSAALDEAGWRAGQSVVVAEGLLMYLPPAAVRDLFAALHALTGPGSRVVFTWLPEEDGALLLHPFVRLGVRLVGEPVRFSAAPEALASLLAGVGWRLLPAADLRARYLAGTVLADEPITSMERFSVAEWIAGSGGDTPAVPL